MLIIFTIVFRPSIFLPSDLWGMESIFRGVKRGVMSCWLWQRRRTPGW